MRTLRSIIIILIVSIVAILSIINSNSESEITSGSLFEYDDKYFHYFIVISNVNTNNDIISYYVIGDSIEKQIDNSKFINLPFIQVKNADKMKSIFKSNPDLKLKFKEVYNDNN